MIDLAFPGRVVWISLEIGFIFNRFPDGWLDPLTPGEVQDLACRTDRQKRRMNSQYLCRSTLSIGTRWAANINPSACHF
jgi:hypothetical protein